MLHSNSELLKEEKSVNPPPNSTGSAAIHDITRRGFLAVSVALLVGGCARNKNADDLESGAQIDALNNLLTGSGWKCVQKNDYPIIGFVYDDKGEYARTVHAHPNGIFIIYVNSQKDSRVARGTTSIETWESDSIEKFSTVDEAAAYIIGLSKTANE